MRLLDLALQVLEGDRIHLTAAVPHHLVVDVVRRGEDQVRLLSGQPGLDRRGVDDARGGDHGLPGKPLGVPPDRPDVQRDPQLDPHHLTGPAVVLAQPAGQLGQQRVDQALGGDRRRHHDDGAVAAVLAVAARPRHPRRVETGPQDLVHRRAHHVTVTVVAHRIGEPGHVGEHDRAVQRLVPVLLPACRLGRGRVRPVRRPGGAGFRRRDVAQRGQAVQVDDGQAAGPLAAGDDPAVPPGPQEPADRVRARPGPVREFLLRHRQGEHRGGGVLVAAPALGQVEQQPGQPPLGAGPFGREQPRPVFLPALGHLAFQHLGGARVAAQELREPFGRNDHRRDLVQRGHGGRTDLGSERGPLPHHVPLAPDGEDLLSAIGVRDADLDPARVDDRHLGGVFARPAQHRPGPEELLHPGGRQRLPLGVGQRVPEAPRGRSLPAHAARGHRNIRDLTRDLTCVLHRTGRVGSLVPFHGQPVPKPLALTMPGARASPRGKSAAARRR